MNPKCVKEKERKEGSEGGREERRKGKNLKCMQVTKNKDNHDGGMKDNLFTFSLAFKFFAMHASIL